MDDTSTNLGTSETANTTVETENENTEAVQTETEVQPQAQTTQDILDWTKDLRYEKSWKKDSNNLYRSYRDMEKTFNPLKQRAEQYDKLTGTFKQFKLEPEKLGEYVKEYQELKNPDRREYKVTSYFDKWLNDPKFSQQVQNFFAELEKAERQAKWGAELSDEIISKLEGLEKFKTEAEKKEQEAKENTYRAEVTATIQTQTKMNEDYAKKHNIEYDDATHNALIQYCQDEGIEPKYMHWAFKNFCEDAILEANKKTAVTDTAKKIQNQRKLGIVTTTKGTAPKTEPKGFRGKLENSPALNRYFKDNNIS